MRLAFAPRTYRYTPLSDKDIRIGGQATRRLLTGTLEEAKRRARLTGRDLSEGEIEGLSRGFYAGATDRLTARKGLALQKRSQDISYARLTSAERMASEKFKLAERGQNITEGLGYAGLKTAERGQTLGLEAAKYGADVAARTQRHVTAETSGFLGGGGFLGTGMCIIITVCTNPNSEEVNITRRYRDKIMLPETLRGYYMLAELVVPLIYKSDKVRRFLKKHLVDSLAATCGWKLGEKEMPSRKARIITGLFLGGCNLLGHAQPQFIRCNSEIF